MIRNIAASSTRWPLLIAIGALMVIGLYVRVWDLWRFDLSPDEALTLLISSEPTIAEVLDSGSRHPHPPLRYIMLHFMLYLSNSVLFLRAIAYLPGVALIPVFFLLGRRTAGTASGITMATLATFGYAGLLLSEVLRTYMLGTFFISVGLYGFFAYRREPKPKYLVVYSAAMTVGLLSHYFTILPITAVGLVWLYRIVRAERPWNELTRATLANLPVAVVALASYVVHISGRYSDAHWNSITGGWLAPHFPGTLAEFLANAQELFGYLFLSPNVWWVMALTVLGIVALWAAKRRDVAAVIILAFAINIVLTVVGKYPFGGTRQCLYLLPLVSLAIGAAVQFGWDRSRAALERRADPGLLQRVAANRTAISYAAVVCFVVLAAGVAYAVGKTDHLRRYDGNGWVELPVMRADVAQALRYVKQRMKPGDVLLAERQTTFYARFETGQAPEPVSATLSKRSFADLVLYDSNLDYSFNLHSDDLLWRSLQDLVEHVEIAPDSTIWIVSIGWQSIKDVITDEAYRYRMVDGWSRGGAGAGVYAIRGSTVVAEVARRFGVEAAKPDPLEESGR